MVSTGAVLAGKYRVKRVLGQGGMGVVVQAIHLQLNQPVAMKFLLPEVLGNAQVVQRFLREAQAVVRLKSEHVARVLDVGSLEDGAPYMVLEYLEGADLAHFSRQQLTIGQVVDLMLQACEALAEAHASGIVHRDIKPANFFITQRSDGSHLLKVLDFGISKIRETTPEGNLTASSMVMGTPSYMSPEQMKSTRNVDNRSDIWALGVVLYELLQGAPPFIAESYGAMAIKVATEPVLPFTVQLPHGLAEIVYRCLEKDPARRFQNVAELAHALAPYAQSTAQAMVSVERTSRVLGTNPPGSPTTLSSSTGTIDRPPHSARQLPFVVGVIVVLGAIVTVAVVVSRDSGQAIDPDPQMTPAALPPTPQTPPDREPARVPAPPDAAMVAAPAPALDAAGPAAPAFDAAITAAPLDAAPAVVTPSQPPTRRPSKPPRPLRPPSDPKQPQPSGNGSDDILGNRY